MKKSDKIKLSIAGVAFALAAVFGYIGLSTREPAPEEQIEQQELEAAGPKGPLDKNRPLGIALVARSIRSYYWKGVNLGVLKASKDLENVRTQYAGVRDDSKRGDQNQRINEVVWNGANGIILGPLDPKTAVGTVNKHAADQIPVLVIDTNIATDKTIGFLPADHKGAGARAAEYLSKLMDGKGQVLVLRNFKGVTYSTDREKAFLDTLKAKAPGIQVVSADQYAGATPDTAQKKAAELLKKFPKVGGVFCSSETASLGMLAALQAAKLAGKVQFIACDPHPKLTEALGKGQVAALVVMDTIGMGMKALQILVGHVRETGEKVEGAIKAILVTKDNMNNPTVKDLLNPDLTPFTHKDEDG